MIEQRRKNACASSFILTIRRALVSCRGSKLRLSTQLTNFATTQLPLPCILNSRYMTPDHMHGLMSLIGFDIVKNRWKDGGKMAYWLFRKTPRCRDLSPNTLEPYEKKQELRQGKNRNNFAILLQNLV